MNDQTRKALELARAALEWPAEHDADVAIAAIDAALNDPAAPVAQPLTPEQIKDGYVECVLSSAPPSLWFEVPHEALRRISALEAERDRLQKANDGQTRLNITLVMENKELIAERGQLRAEVEALRDYCENARHLARLVCDELNVPILHDAPAAIEALRADAERYRWLIDKGISGGFTVVQDDGRKMLWHTGPSLTQTIDAARKQQ